MQRELDGITDGTAEYAPEAVAAYQPNETAEPRIKQATYEPTRMTGVDVWVKRTAISPRMPRKSGGESQHARPPLVTPGPSTAAKHGF